MRRLTKRDWESVANHLASQCVGNPLLVEERVTAEITISVYEGSDYDPVCAKVAALLREKYHGFCEQQRKHNPDLMARVDREVDVRRGRVEAVEA